MNLTNITAATEALSLMGDKYGLVGLRPIVVSKDKRSFRIVFIWKQNGVTMYRIERPAISTECHKIAGRRVEMFIYNAMSELQTLGTLL